MKIKYKDLKPGMLTDKGLIVLKGDVEKRLPKAAFCSICGSPANYRYAPCDPPAEGEEGYSPPESERWRCESHKPYAATKEGWNGEWDKY